MKDFLHLFEIQNIRVIVKHQISLPSVIFIYEVVVLLRSLEFISVHSTNPVRLIPHKIFVIQYLFLRSKFVSRYLTQLNKAALKILQDEAVAYFDSYSWGISDTVHERMKKFSERTGINFSQEVLSKIENYLIMVNTNDIAGIVDGLLSMGLSNAAALDTVFEKLALNSLVIPDDILEPQERKFFPYPSLELLLQDKVWEENL